MLWSLIPLSHARLESAQSRAEGLSASPSAAQTIIIIIIIIIVIIITSVPVLPWYQYPTALVPGTLRSSVSLLLLPELPAAFPSHEIAA